MRPRVSPGKLEPEEITKLHEAMRNVNLNEGQSMNILRYANRVPLQFQAGACAITQTVMGTNWRSYGLSQSRGSLPSGPVTLMVHMASVWVPFTSESKEAVASYPEIQKELRLALQAVGRKLGHVPQPPQAGCPGRRAAFDLPALPGRSRHGRQPDQPHRPRQVVRTPARRWPRRRPRPPTSSSTTAAGSSRRPDDDPAAYGENVLIVPAGPLAPAVSGDAAQTSPEGQAS